MKPIIIGTRGSQLALYQANKTKSELEQAFPEQTFEIKIIKTKGDKILDVALSKIGDKGLFTKELEVELLNGSVDMAVHSLKDLPTVFPENLTLGAVLKRGNFKDALVSATNKKITDLDETDIIATSSLRRRAQLLKINPDFNIVDIRGNVNTRLKKMDEGYCTAMIMAAAGLERLGLDNRISELIDPELIIPAVAQGAIGIEIRENDNFIADILSKINHPETAKIASAERIFLRTLEGGCQVPIGAYTAIQDDIIKITGFISGANGLPFIKDSVSGHINDADKLAKKLANAFLNKDAEDILTEVRIYNQK